MIDLREFQRLSDKLEALKRQADRAEGAKAQLAEQLKKDFGVDSLADAKKLLRKLEKEGEKLDREYREALKTFDDKWGDKLEGS